MENTQETTKPDIHELAVATTEIAALIDAMEEIRYKLQVLGSPSSCILSFDIEGSEGAVRLDMELEQNSKFLESLAALIQTSIDYRKEKYHIDIE